MAYKSLGGKTRRYVNTETGETISRRQFQNLQTGVSFEEKAKRNKAADLRKALARPARGRTKAQSNQEIEMRLEAAEQQAEQHRVSRINRAAKAAGQRVKVKKIRPQLLKTGHRAARIPFETWDEFQDLRKQMLSQKLPNGRRLISSYGLGIVGYDERTGQQIAATLVRLQSPSIDISEDELEAMSDDFIMEHPYFIFSHFFLHLHFDINYAESRAKKSREKNIPREHRKNK